MKAAARWRSESEILDAEARRHAPGSFVRLSAGFTHFEETGPRDDSLPVVLVHGFSVPYFICVR